MTLRHTVRMIPDENLHLTLRFLGDTEEALRRPLEAALRRSAAGSAPIRVRLAGGGCFPHLRNPRVLWAGLEDGTGALTELHRRLSAELDRLAFEPADKPFHPHVTIAYLRKGIDRAEARRTASALEAFRGDPIGVEAAFETLALKESHLRRTGAVHTTVSAVNLSGTGNPR